MPELSNQKEYWDSVAHTKTFTHPLDTAIIADYFKKDFRILDYGCGYGRLTSELHNIGFVNSIGVDTSPELIQRGQALYPALNLQHIQDAQQLRQFADHFDVVILFAVLTCIPPNAAQKELIEQLYNRLKPGGFLYISDYYLQDASMEVKAYTSLAGDPANYGVFRLAEGAVFRHHTQAWIKELLRHFELLSEKIIPVTTMNGHVAEGFQILAKK